MINTTPQEYNSLFIFTKFVVACVLLFLFSSSQLPPSLYKSGLAPKDLRELRQGFNLRFAGASTKAFPNVDCVKLL